MECTQANELMLEYLYRELQGEQATQFRSHVDGCARCGAELSGLERTRAAFRSVPEAEPPASVTARLLHEAARRAPEPQRRGGPFGWLLGLLGPLGAHPALAAAASLVLVAGVAGVLWQTGKVTQQPGAVAPAPPPVPAAAAEPDEPAEAGVPVKDLEPQAQEADEAEPVAQASRDDEAPKAKKREAASVPEDTKKRYGEVRKGRMVPAEQEDLLRAKEREELRQNVTEESAVVGGAQRGAGVQRAPAQAAAAQAAPAAPPPPAPEPQPARQKAASRAEKAAAPAMESPFAEAPQGVASPQNLYSQAVAAARSGDCARALELRDRLARQDPAFLKGKVKMDPLLQKCDMERRATQKAPVPDQKPARRAPVRSK